MPTVLRLVLLVALFAIAACSAEEPAKPLSEPGEKLYPIRGVILSREATSNTINVDHEEIPGFMAAMKMDYSVRGTEVASLPPDNSRFEATLHVTERGYWLTDIRQIP